MTNLLVVFLGVVAVSAAEDSDRRLGAILGSFVADAAAMPLHWIYSTAKVKELVGQGDPEFYHTPSCPFYDYALGENTPYGQQTLAYLNAVKGKTIDPAQMQKAYEALYTSGGRCYTTTQNASKCYKDGSTKEFLKNVASGLNYPKCGGNDTQANAVAHMPLVVAKFAGQADLLDQVEHLIRVTQNTNDAVAFGLAGARILEAVILGDSGIIAVKKAVTAMKSASRSHPMDEDAALAKGIEHVLSELDKSSFDVVQEVGQSCDYPVSRSCIAVHYPER
jgi:ADP-ribosylglycohydrolase